MCDKAVNTLLPTLKFIADWFLSKKKMIKNLDKLVFPVDDIVIVNEDSANVTFSSDEMGIFSVDLNNINLDRVNFYEDDPEPLFLSDLWLDVIDLIELIDKKKFTSVI